MEKMTAMEFLKEYGRMCKLYDLDCSECPFCEFRRKYDVQVCRINMIEHPEEAVDIVQKWAEEHPVKTMLQDFFEKHPKAARRPEGDPIGCVVTLGYRTGNEGCFGNCCFDCWNRPLEE